MLCDHFVRQKQGNQKKSLRRREASEASTSQAASLSKEFAAGPSIEASSVLLTV